MLVNVNLIDTRDDHQVWAERYDRTLAASLTLQGELATEIAAALHATLSPEEKARVEAKPTNNADAYVLYLRAREHEIQVSTDAFRGREGVRSAILLYNEAVTIDPAFALAHARLAGVLAYTYHAIQPTEALKVQARIAAENALRLRPDLGEGYLARALCLYWTEENYELALLELETAARLLPNDADVQAYASFIRCRQGRWKEALAGFEHALARDPRNPRILSGRFTTKYLVRDWPAAARAAEQALAVASSSTTLLQIEKAYVDLWASDDLAPLRHVLASVPRGFDPDGTVTLARWDAALLARNFGEAQRAVLESLSETILTSDGTPFPKQYLLGCIEIARGEPDRAQPFLQAALPRLEAEVLALPLDAFPRARLGLLYAFLRRKEDALREGRRAVELLPTSKDAVTGPQLTGLLSVIYAQTGEHDQAVELVEQLLITPGAVSPFFEGSITRADLRLRWQWDALRDDPRFQKILAGPEPQTVIIGPR